MAVARSLHERCNAEFLWQVDARAPLQQLFYPCFYHLHLAVGCSDVEQADGCGLTVTCWNRAERVDRPSVAQPLDHLLQLASRHRLVDLEGQRGGRARRGLVSVRWGGRRGGGRLRRRCVLPDEIRGAVLARVFGPLQDGAAVAVEQLGVGLGSQQGLHARPLPLPGGHHQGGGAVAGLEVRAGRVVQEEAQEGEVAAVSSIHERGSAEAALQ
eukprot:scaffold1995_cov75-Phaeocystis_antarctica.AAC.2